MTGTWDAVQSGGVQDPAKAQTANEIITLAKEIMNDKALSASVGPYSSRLPSWKTLTGETADFAAKAQRLQSLLTLGNLGVLKGAISDKDMEVLQSAASSLKPGMTEQAYKTELQRIIDTTSKGLSNAGGQSSGITTQSLVQKGVRQDLIDQLTALGKTPQEIAQIAGVSFTNAPSKALNGSQIGSLSAKYESGGNPGAIGYDSTGGYSYGTYQLAHNNAQRFVAESPYAQQFAGIPFNSAAFQQKWKEIAAKDPQGFAAAQHDYIAKTHYEPVINRIASMGVDPNKLSQTVKDVIWSTAVQHGPGSKIVDQAIASARDEKDLIQKIYQLRWNNGSGFASSTPAVKQSVYNRFFGPSGELNTALSRLA